MFRDNDRAYIENALVNNTCVLFLGAGFSRLATNQLGKPMPLGRDLAASIWQFMDYSGQYDGTPLPVLFEALLTKGVRRRPEIRDFLERELMCSTVPQSYDAIADPFWYRVYTTNVDDLLHLVYRRTGRTRLSFLSFPDDYSAERDHSLRSLQAIYLNGRLPCDPDKLTFSISQYAGTAASRHEPLYDQFVTDYSTHPTIFVGTQLDEPLLWQYVEARQTRHRGTSEHRPRSFLIVPTLSQPRADALAQFNVVPVIARVDEFLSWLDALRPRIPTRIETLKSTLPGFTELIREADVPESVRRDLEQFAIHFESVPVATPKSRDRSAYLLGATPRWTDITRDLDAPREVGTQLSDRVRIDLGAGGTLPVYVIHGSAGCGKSTILRRLGLTLAREGHPVFITNSEEIPLAGVIASALEHLNRKAVLLFDNAEVNLRAIATLVPALTTIPHPPVVVVATRTNDYRRRFDLFETISNVQAIPIPNLSRQEIIDVLAVLERNNLLGRLRGMPLEKRIAEFEIRAAKQILVAMREATSGRLFDDIIRDEFDSLASDEAKALYLCVALCTDAGHRLPLEDFVGCSESAPADALEILDVNLRDIVLRTGGDFRLLLLRHRKIAEFMVNSGANRRILLLSYIRLLSVLAGHLRGMPRSSATVKLYIRLINHYTISGRFSENPEFARDVYDSLADRFPNDAQFWLQYGSLELQVDNLDVAENYLNQADSLDPRNGYIRNALGLLAYRRSVLSGSRTESEPYRATARQRLQESITDEYTRDHHAYHIILSQEMKWILRWVRDKEEQARLLGDLRRVGDKAKRLFPHDRNIGVAADEVERHYLMIATD